MSKKARARDDSTRTSVKVVIICEDLESGKKAKELQDHMLQALEPRIEFVPELWTFRALQHPELQELAIKEVAEADLVVFSIRGDGDLPLWIKNGLAGWIAKENRPRALVALFGSGEAPRQLDETRLFLEEIATKGCLDFFVDGPPSAASSEARGWHGQVLSAGALQ